MKVKIFPLICAISLLCSCNLQQEKNYQGNMKISDNGIIEQAVFRQIKDDNAVVTFSGMILQTLII